MIELTLRLYQYTDVETLHRYLAKKLDFPAYYGKNLDALYDCLGDIFRDYMLNIFYDEQDGYQNKIVEIFKKISIENTHIQIQLNRR